jgi:signal transduction histidine kinase
MNGFPIEWIFSAVTAVSAAFGAIAVGLWAYTTSVRGRREIAMRREQQYILERFMHRGSREEIEALAPYLIENSRTDYAQQKRLASLIDRLDEAVHVQSRSLDQAAESAAIRTGYQIDRQMRAAIAEIVGQLKNDVLQKVASESSDSQVLLLDGGNVPRVPASTAREISHALLTPLARVDAICRTLENNPISASIADDLSKITSAIQVCFVYLNAFRATDYVPGGDLPDFKTALESATNVYKEKRRESAKISIICDDGLSIRRQYYVIACVLPLIENAIESTPRGIIEIKVILIDNMIQIAISNECTDKIDTEKIFVNGYTTKSSGSKSHEGLGLGIARSLAIGGGGTLEAHQADGRLFFILDMPNLEA